MGEAVKPVAKKTELKAVKKQWKSPGDLGII